METIFRTISIEPYKSRLPGLIPSINSDNYDNGNWGKLIKSIDFNLVENDLKSLGVLSYRTLINRYYFILNLYKNATYYKCYNVNNVDEFKWLIYTDDITDYETIIIDDTLPLPTSLNNGDIYGIVSADELRLYNEYKGLLFFNFIKRSFGEIIIPNNIKNINTPNSLFLVEVQQWVVMLTNLKDSIDCCSQERYIKLGGDNLLNFLVFYMDNDILNKEIEYFKNISTTIKTDINISIPLTSDIDIIGEYTPLIGEWVAGRRYYIYTNTNPDGTIIKNGDLVIYDNVLYELNPNTVIEYYDGFFSNSDREIYFDVLNDKNEIVLTHWREVIANSDINQTLIEYTTESQLKSLRRVVKNYDDYGQELPGILTLLSVESDGRRVYSDKLELIYNTQASNITSNTFINNNGVLQTNYYGNIIYEINEDVDKITFKYVIGCEFDMIGETLTYLVDTNFSGIRYSETYDIMTNVISTMVDGVNYDFTYVNIMVENNNVTIFNEKLNNTPISKIMSSAEHLNNDLYSLNRITNEFDYTDIPVISEEYKMGVTTPQKINSNIFIDRGANAAFEKHNKLGEIHTMNDLLSYGNSSFFIIK